MRNLDLTTLRSFVAVADAGGVTRAAGFLNLTQSAVSMQLKRLEDGLGLALLDRSGRGVALTPAGEQLLKYARRMVDLNDEIYARLTRQDWEGEIVLGVPHDIVYPVIPRIIKRMGRDMPRVRVQLISSYTAELKEQFARGAVDVILTTEADPAEGGEPLLDVPLRWYGAAGGSAWKSRPLRIAFSRRCGFRPVAAAMMEQHDIDWELAVDSESDRIIEVSVTADLAVTPVLEGHAPAHYDLIPRGVLPDLGVQKICLYGSAAKPQILAPVLEMLRAEFRALGTRGTEMAAQ
ncbi:LysR family transcriptional regulator [Salipiger marinus]|jgi:DNA-binding transcriptional LysR family regulator|uniref:DNA-binding transcriptional regulator, LysR family n=1 Tax=Salipiger marinus TaxID=555512 RepID=A0A1G8MY32_9RHOB|nr:MULTISPECIES: LysR family transcriptional regulator [Salipiger]HBM62280.1 LysR family transcriptional regulator [Citreicella sp.]MCD1616535.1 LysR family transcriptional regulator [Salipiger manganoxidans]MEB3418975.1 LysR family transcriptional regulator [Salipiger manganoxidans]SDI72891.1 DNA-binding transcriptional regulator, LysR family [Salipiger marinus]HBT00704.1 LysR family transcriptional regulator [Citreicella sp.]|tara:strand:+ start:153 stop:1028 length:876 start_codon:yes stop_codon:yes gene_type:complete